MRPKEPDILYQLLLQRLAYFTSIDAPLEPEWVRKPIKEHRNQGRKEREGKLQEKGYVRRPLRNKTRIWMGVNKEMQAARGKGQQSNSN
jgi:hypothetical protein